MPPKSYGQPKGSFWQGTKELDRFPPTYPEKEELFADYMTNQSMSPSRHVKSLGKSSGLLELHYDTMRKRQIERAATPCFVHSPTMDRPFAAMTGYSGFIPGKISGNVVGCSFANGSKLAHETTGQFYDPPMSGVSFTMGAKSPMGRSSSSPSLGLLSKPADRGML